MRRAKATQLIYCELSTPKGQRQPQEHTHAVMSDTYELRSTAMESPQEDLDKNFVYHEIREKLAQRGIPPEQVAFIQEHATKTRRAALFAAMNRGEVRVLIASKQSTGMNIQQRLIALHNLDAPWRPGDLEQRIGRIERQGNQWPEIFVCNYVTEGSFDGYIWQTLETKARFIGQMRSGDVSIRTIDDISEAVLSAAEIKAIASGNPKVIQKVQLDAELIKLASLHSSHRDTQVRMRRKLGDIAYSRERMRERRTLLIAAQALAEQHQQSDFKAAVLTGALTTEAIAYSKREAAGQALRKVAAELFAQAEATSQKIARTIGGYHGFMLCVQAHPRAAAPDVFLALEQDGALVPAFATPIKTETDLGVWSSADSQIRSIPEALQRIDAELARIDQEEIHITSALDLPWEQAERYARMQAELERVERRAGPDPGERRGHDRERDRYDLCALCRPRRGAGGGRDLRCRAPGRWRRDAGHAGAAAAAGRAASAVRPGGDGARDGPPGHAGDGCGRSTNRGRDRARRRRYGGGDRAARGAGGCAAGAGRGGVAPGRCDPAATGLALHAGLWQHGAHPAGQGQETGKGAHRTGDHRRYVRDGASRTAATGAQPVLKQGTSRRSHQVERGASSTPNAIKKRSPLSIIYLLPAGHRYARWGG